MSFEKLTYPFWFVVRRGPLAIRRRILRFQQKRSFRPPAAAGSKTAVAVELAGGLGDQFIIARFIRDLATECPELVFDVFSANPAITSWVFKGIPAFNQAYIDALFKPQEEGYAFSMAISATVTLRRGFDDAATLEAQHPRFAQLVERIRQFNTENKALVENQPYMDNFIGLRLVYANARRHTAFHAIAGIEYRGDELPIELDHSAPERHGLVPGKYITIHNGFGTEIVTTGSHSTRLYPHYEAVVAQLKAKFPDRVIVQVGAPNSPRLRNVDKNLIGATKIPEVAAIVAHADVHLDNESGIVHMSRCFGTRSCVVFGPTNPDFFAYDANINVRPLQCGSCWWIKRDWMANCVKGFAEPVCTHTQPPENIVAAAEKMMAQRSG